MRGLELRGVSQRYDARTVLHEVELVVGPGRCCALLGANGAGKSTLLRVAAGRERPTSGTVSVDGQVVQEERRASRIRVASVLGPPACYPDLTLEEHLMLVATAHRVPDAEAASDAVVDRLGIAGHRDAFPSQLSSGLRQLLALGAAMVRPYQVLLLDEPEQHLDRARRSVLAGWIAADLSRGRTVVLATHDPSLVRDVAHDGVVLDEGRVVRRGRAGDVVDALGL